MFVLVEVLMEVKILINSGLTTFNWSSASKENASWMVDPLNFGALEDLGTGAEREGVAEAAPLALGPQEVEAPEAGVEALEPPPKTGKADSSLTERLEPLVTEGSEEVGATASSFFSDST